MGNLIRFYNQNRERIWLAIIFIVFIVLIVNVLNSIYKDKAEEQKKQNASSSNNQVKDYTHESKSLVSENDVPEYYKKDFGNLIDNFLTYCKNHEPEKAYDLLSQSCKEILYQNNEKIFEEQYYEPRFSKDKSYSFQSWTSGETYVYMVKIFDNMLATGNGGSEKYIQDYISIVKEDELYRLNTEGLVAKVDRNKEVSSDGVTFTIMNSAIYMDYEIATFVVKNETQYDILIDSREKTDTMYAVDGNNISFEAMAFENSDDDFIVPYGEEKVIKIKFSNPYRDRNNAVKYVFSDVYMDAEHVNYGVNNREFVIQL